MSTATEGSLKARRAEITVAYVDLRGFTSFTETAEPEEVMSVLRQYHAELGRLIMLYDGTLAARNESDSHGNLSHWRPNGHTRRQPPARFPAWGALPSLSRLLFCVRNRKCTGLRCASGAAATVGSTHGNTYAPSQLAK
jgi:class 3 adenylate cyclase